MLLFRCLTSCLLGAKFGCLFRSICNCIASVLLKLYYYLVVIKIRLNLLTSFKVPIRSIGIGIGIDILKILTIYIPILYLN